MSRRGVNHGRGSVTPDAYREPASFPARAPTFHTACEICGQTFRSDLIKNHLAWIHDQGVHCLTCRDRGWITDPWDDWRECPKCFSFDTP